LRQRDLPIVCLDARHAKAALSLQINKSDSNDAFGLAQVVRTGWFREVAVKSMDAQTLRMLLVARAQLVSQRQTLANTIRGLQGTSQSAAMDCCGLTCSRRPMPCSPGICAPAHCAAGADARGADRHAPGESGGGTQTRRGHASRLAG
jgi:hypothetical protein